MWVMELVFALIIAFVLAVLLAYAFQRRGPGPFEGLIFFFLILLFAIWAGGVWLTPIGPAIQDISWLSFLIVGIVVALILAAALPSRRAAGKGAAREGEEEETEKEGEGEEDERRSSALGLGVFFYLLLLLLLLAIGLYHLYYMT